MNPEDKITYFGETDYRNKRTRFGIKAKDRVRHMYVIGKTGMGKSTVLENMAIQDIQNGEGIAFIDPHGSSAEKLLEYVPENRVKDVVYFAPFDTDFPMSFNVLEDVGADKRHLVVSGLMSVFKKIWQDAWSARMEYILNNTLLALLEYPGSTLMGVNKMLSDKEYRKKVVDNVKDPAVKSFWVDEYAKYTEKFAAEATPAIQNKIGQYTLNPLIRNIIGQPKSSFDIRELMDNKKIFIINLSKGRIGEQNMNLLGGMFVTKIYLAAMSRADLSAEDLAKLPPFYLYVDEFQNFANESFSQILSEARKYKLALTVANQYVTQMVDEVRDAIFGNVGTIVCYRVGATDAEVFEKEFAPLFTSQDIVNLGLYQMYLSLMIDGVGSKPFSALGLPPIQKPEKSYREQVIESSRKMFAHTKKEVEEGIEAWHASLVPEKPKRDFPTDGAPKSSFNQTPANDRQGQNFAPRASNNNFTPKPVFNRSENAQSANTPKPVFNKPNNQQQRPINSSQKTVNPAVDRRAEEKKPFAGLKDLINRIDTEDLPKENKNSIQTNSVDNSNTAPISLSNLKSKTLPPKDPTPENRNALKNVLAQVIADNKKDIPPPPPVKKTEPVPVPQKQVVTPVMTSSVPAGNQQQYTPPSTNQNPVNSNPVTKKPKEIPEDILRKVLE